MVGKNQELSEPRLGSTKADKEKYCARRESFRTERKYSAGTKAPSVEESKRFTKLTISEVSLEAESLTRDSPQTEAEVQAGSHPSNGQAHGHSRRWYRRKRADKQAREAFARTISTSVTDAAFEASLPTGEQVSRPTRTTQVAICTPGEVGAVAA
jgi:hypothetical protein